MILFRALKQNSNMYASGGIVDHMIKHPKKLFYKFHDGKFNIKHGDKEYVLDIEDKDIVSSSISKLVSEAIGTNSFGVIKKDNIELTKVDNYFIFVYNFKSNDESFEIIYDMHGMEECVYYVSIVGKFYILEDASSDKNVNDIKDVTGIESVNEIEVTRIDPIAYSEPEPMIASPIQQQPTIHEQSAMGVPIKDEYDTAMNDSKYTGPVMPI